jgi:hypothetical protein
MIMRSEEYCQFVISATKFINSKKNQAYFFLRKKNTTVNELIQESMQSEKKALFSRLSNEFPQFKTMRFDELMSYLMEE